MSGLVAWVDVRRDLRRHEDVLHSMTEAMGNRGPDGKGTYVCRHAALGHRRLDTGDPGAAHQPAIVQVGDASVVLAYDGTIYNLPELRRQLEGQLTTGTDTDVLLRCYLAWGEDFVDRLNGIFAVAVWDGGNQRLLLGRDRMGVKPLYYFQYPDGVLVASAPKGIMANSLFEARLDLSVISILLQPRLALPGETPLVGLREVPPAHVVLFSDRGSESRRYWRLTSAVHEHSFDETVTHVRELLADSVSRQVPHSGTCGAMLSGGIDSTSVAALASDAFRNEDANRVLHTFCVEFESDREHFSPTELRPEVDSPYAALAAAHIGSQHTTVTTTTSQLVDVFPATRRARDLPGWGQFDASMYLLFSRMRETCSIGLSGEAADEFFGGYPYFFKPELVQRPTFPWLGEGPRLADYLAPEVTGLVDRREDEQARYHHLLSEVPRLPGEDPAEARMREVLFLGMSGPLAVVLDRKERMSMSQGLEMRLPYCDHRLVQYVWNVPWSMKCAGGPKGLLKAATADLLPVSTLTRQKSAYPHVHDPSHELALVREAEWLLNDQSSPLHGLFDAPRFNELLRRITASELRSSLPGGASGAQLLVQLTELRHWIDEYQVSLR